MGGSSQFCSEPRSSLWSRKPTQEACERGSLAPRPDVAWTVVNRTFQQQMSTRCPGLCPDIIRTSGPTDKERPELPRAQCPIRAQGVFSPPLS